MTTRSQGPADLVPVFRTADPRLLAVLKTVLEAAGIEFVVQGDTALGMLPLGPLATGLTRNLLAATILVAPADAGEARDLLDHHAEPLSGDDDVDEAETGPVV